MRPAGGLYVFVFGFLLLFVFFLSWFIGLLCRSPFCFRAFCFLGGLLCFGAFPALLFTLVGEVLAQRFRSCRNDETHCRANILAVRLPVVALGHCKLVGKSGIVSIKLLRFTVTFECWFV